MSMNLHCLLFKDTYQISFDPSVASPGQEKSQNGGKGEGEKGERQRKVGERGREKGKKGKRKGGRGETFNQRFKLE